MGANIKVYNTEKPQSDNKSIKNSGLKIWISIQYLIYWNSQSTPIKINIIILLKLNKYDKIASANHNYIKQII